MKFLSALTLPAKILASLGALLISYWLGMPWWSIAGVALLTAGSVAAGIWPDKNREPWYVGMASIGAVSTVGYLLFGPHYWDGFHVLWGGLVTAPLLLVGFSAKSRALAKWWRILAGVCAFATNTVWLGIAYQQNDRLQFYAALLICFGLLVLQKKWFRLPGIAVLAVNTLILFLIGLPLANLCVSPADSLGIPPRPSEKPYSYEFFKKDPAGYARWMNYLQGQYISLQQLYIPLSEGPMGHRLRPNSQVMFCEGTISINRKGFRGAEIADEKKDAYRIVVLGESTTFGYTMFADEKTWCESLEELIQTRLKPSRPVQVINAGVPAYNILHNLYRFPSEILPLKPDLLISYHGYNGFFLVSGSLPPVSTSRPPPAYQPRPFKILADFEYRLKLDRFKRDIVLKTVGHEGPLQEPLDSGYANAYRQLIQLCRTNGIHLVLSTYSMAVNGQSDKDIIQFYHQTILSLPTVLSANVIHTAIVRQLAAANPDVGLVDTQPGLDGVHEKFIDVMHFSPEGEQQMAETVFAGIKDFLVEKLAQPATP